ncbi:MAG: ADP-heptose:LPS heptosyltransferase [Planctomycetota bacterium]|jgi:ADP-heptose:LPS heptosyltransferase
MKVVIIKLGALGDIIMSTPIIKSLLLAHRNDEPVLLTSSQYAGLFDEWPGLPVIHFPRSGLGAAMNTLRWLRAQNFDRVYDLQSNDRSRIYCALSGIKEKVGNHSHFPYTHHPGDCYTGQNHIFDRHKQLLTSAGIVEMESKPWLPVPEQTQARVDQWLRQHSLIKDKLVLIHAGASALHPKKRWPYFSELAEKLSASGYSIVWLGAGDDAMLNAELASVHGVDASNAFSVVELIALGRQARLAITNDSGPMHVLACSDLPVYAFFGPTDWRRNHAIGQRERVLSLSKSNSVWRAEDYRDVNIDDLALITAEMAWSFLLQENDIKP